VNVRSGPGRQYAQAGKIKIGTAVRICAPGDDWTGILYGNGRTGWVATRFVASASKPSSTAASTAARSASPQAAAKPTAKAAAGWASAYDRQGYKLGMTLSQFRQKPYPDEATARGTFAVCSGDKIISQGNYADAELFSASLERAGLTKCVFYRKAEISANFDLALSAGLNFGDKPAPTEFYFMAPAADREPVLFWIKTKGPADGFDALAAALRKEYGPPAAKGVEPVRNVAGRRLDTPVIVWRNDVSQVRLKRFGETAEIFDLQHVLTPVMDELDRKLGQRSADATRRP
jgi:hypothetical protein